MRNIFKIVTLIFLTLIIVGCGGKGGGDGDGDGGSSSSSSGSSSSGETTTPTTTTPTSTTITVETCPSTTQVYSGDTLLTTSEGTVITTTYDSNGNKYVCVNSGSATITRAQ